MIGSLKDGSCIFIGITPVGINGELLIIPLTLPLSPAFAEAASRRQAPGEREII